MSGLCQRHSQLQCRAGVLRDEPVGGHRIKDTWFLSASFPITACGLQLSQNKKLSLRFKIYKSIYLSIISTPRMVSCSVNLWKEHFHDRDQSWGMDHVSSQTRVCGLGILAVESTFQHFLSKEKVLILGLLIGFSYAHPSTLRKEAGCLLAEVQLWGVQTRTPAWASARRMPPEISRTLSSAGWCRDVETGPRGLRHDRRLTCRTLSCSMSAKDFTSTLFCCNRFPLADRGPNQGSRGARRLPVEGRLLPPVTEASSNSEANEMLLWIVNI